MKCSKHDRRGALRLFQNIPRWFVQRCITRKAIHFIDTQRFATFLHKQFWYWPVVRNRRLCRDGRLFLGWLQNKCKRQWGTQKHHPDNECKSHGGRSQWSVYSLEADKHCCWFYRRRKKWRDRDAVLGIVCQGLGTWVFIFLYPSLALRCLTLLSCPLFCVKKYKEDDPTEREILMLSRQTVRGEVGRRQKWAWCTDMLCCWRCILRLKQRHKWSDLLALWHQAVCYSAECTTVASCRCCSLIFMFLCEHS